MSSVNIYIGIVKCCDFLYSFKFISMFVSIVIHKTSIMKKKKLSRNQLTLNKVKISKFTQYSIKGGTDNETLVKAECMLTDGCASMGIDTNEPCTSTDPVSNPRGEKPKI